MFDTLSDRLDKVFTSLRGKGRLSDADIDATAREIRIALLEADVALPVVKAFIGDVKERARGAEVSQALNPAQQVIKIVNEELVAHPRRRDPADPLRQAVADRDHARRPAGRREDDPGRQARQAGSRRRATPRCSSPATCSAPTPSSSCRSSAARPGSTSSRPSRATASATRSQVARDSHRARPAQMHDVVVVDTAGRLGIDAELMQQAADIRDAVQPDEVLFVVDAMIGQDAVTTAQAFQDGVGFTGVVLTKLDGDARGGAALSVRHLTGQPILFASTGEKLGDFDVFHPERMASRILGMGDVLTLIEQAEQAFDADQAERMAGKLQSGEGFDLEDFLEQMMAIKKMGSITSLLGMLPGMGQMKEHLDQVNDRDLDRIAAIIRSMTPQERRNPKILNGSRRVRIAKGSGVTVTEVNNLVDRFYEAQKMMSQMAGSMGMPGMGPMSKKAARPAEQAQAKKGKKGKGGKGKGGPARRPVGAPGLPPGAGNPFGGMPGGMPGLPPGQGLPDLTKLNFDQFKDERRPVSRPLARCTCPVWCSPRASTATCGCATGRFTFEPVPGAETVSRGGWLLPGLVDAHCHVGIARGGGHVEDLAGRASRRWPSGRPGCWRCATAARPSTPGRWTTSRTCRGSSGPGGTSPAPPLHPRARRRDRARGPGRRGARAGPARRRLGEAGG